MTGKSAQSACFCGKGAYATCCARFISGIAVPATAEQLMRSRYTAFALRNEAYLRSTWHPEMLPTEPVTADNDVKWFGLDILRHQHDADAATIEFVARFKVGGRAHRLHEVSRFVRQADATGVTRWYYVDGSFPHEK